MSRRKFDRVVLAFTIGLVLGAGTTWAGTIEIPVFGTQTATTIDPGKQWTDEEGVFHIRGLENIVEAEGQDMEGVPVVSTAHYEININIDLATGDGDFISRGTQEMTYGDLIGVWEGGNANATISGFVYDGTFNWPRGSGDFDGWHMRGIWTGFFTEGESHWDGVFQIPGGGGGDKAAAYESETWSSVKALYR